MIMATAEIFRVWGLDFKVKGSELKAVNSYP